MASTYYNKGYAIYLSLFLGRLVSGGCRVNLLMEMEASRSLRKATNCFSANLGQIICLVIFLFNLIAVEYFSLKVEQSKELIFLNYFKSENK